MELVKQKCEGMSLLYGGCHPLELPDSAGTVAVGFNLPPAMPWKFGPLRARPALDCGAPLRSPCCAGLGGLTPPYALAPSARTDPAVSQRFLPPDLIEPPFPMQRPASVSESAGATQLKEASSGRTVRLRAHLVGEVKVLSK